MKNKIILYIGQMSILVIVTVLLFGWIYPFLYNNPNSFIEAIGLLSALLSASVIVHYSYYKSNVFFSRLKIELLEYGRRNV